MSGIALLLSDLHLPARPSPLRDTFLAFLKGPAREAQAVYILGDLFDHWLGDDLGLIDFAAEVRALVKLSETGAALYLMHGNRDFLVGPRFARLSGMRLLDDPVMHEIGSQPTLLSHGDGFCTADRAYQRWRRFAHQPRVQQWFLNLPARWRRGIGAAARRHSESGKRRKPAAIMDVDEGAVRDAFERSGVSRMIHGHTHRPAEHRLRLADREVERIVLADWRPQRCEVLRCEGTGIERILL